MFSIKQWLHVAVLVNVHLPWLYAQPELEENVGFDSNLPNPNLVSTNSSYIRRILTKMADMGIQFLNDSNILENQILVIAVFSESEFHSRKQDITDDMIKIHPNENICNLPAYFYNVSVHGEILAIYFNKTIAGLLDKKRNSEDTRPPYIFIFSYYIPCAGLTHVHYSCAEELSNLGRVNKDRYKIIVGYRSVWRECDKELALQLLQEGGIHTLMNISSGQVHDERHNVELEIYQEKFIKCLMTLTAITKDSAVYFINAITKNCTSGSDLYGYMTQYTKAVMHECVEKYVKKLPLELYARYCSLETLPRTVRLILGRPTSISEASWTNTSDDLNWNDLYKEFTDTTTPEFSPFNDSSENLEKALSKSKTEFTKAESKNRLFRNLYRKTKLEDLKKDIVKKIAKLKKDEKENEGIREREREIERLQKPKMVRMNARERHT